jgi:hypothetical protein
MDWKNEGLLDRGLRVAVGIGLLAAGWSGAVAGVPGLVCKIAGFVPLATGLIGTCPLYLPLGISTRGKG